MLTSPEIQAWADSINDELGLQDFSLYVTRHGDIKLDMIAVPKHLRKQGVGGHAVALLTQLADKHGMRIILTIGLKDSHFGTTSKSRLIKFYKQFGFVENSGQNKDFTIIETMYRNPKAMSIQENNKLSFKQFLIEVPLPSDFDKDVFTTSTSFAKKIQHAKERAQRIGAGTSRVAFKVDYQGRPTVLKIAKNKKGLAQNEHEAGILSEYYLQSLNIAIPIIDYDETSSQPTWVHTEFATRAKDSDFIKVSGGTLKDISNYLTLKTDKMSIRSAEFLKDSIDKINEDSDFISSLMDLAINYQLPIGDFRRLANWGIYKGKPVIIDLGLSADILKTYYS